MPYERKGKCVYKKTGENQYELKADTTKTTLKGKEIQPRIIPPDIQIDKNGNAKLYQNNFYGVNNEKIPIELKKGRDEKLGKDYYYYIIQDYSVPFQSFGRDYVNRGELKVIKYVGDSEPKYQINVKEGEEKGLYEVDQRLATLNKLNNQGDLVFHKVGQLQTKKEDLPKNTIKQPEQEKEKVESPKFDETLTLPQELINLYMQKAQGKEMPLQTKTYKPMDLGTDIATSMLKGFIEGASVPISKQVTGEIGKQEALKTVKDFESLTGKRFTDIYKPTGERLSQQEKDAYIQAYQKGKSAEVSSKEYNDLKSQYEKLTGSKAGLFYAPQELTKISEEKITPSTEGKTYEVQKQLEDFMNSEKFRDLSIADQVKLQKELQKLYQGQQSSNIPNAVADALGIKI